MNDSDSKTLAYLYNGDDSSPIVITGKYCTGGRIAGDCAAGYYCVSGMDIPDPNNTYAPDGQLCPYGYYCPAGNTNTAVQD